MNKIIIVAGVIGTIVIIGGGVLLLQNQQESVIFEKKEAEAPKMIEGYDGQVLAGKTSPYLDFKKQDYEKALQEEKIVFLNFYANWCPICRAEAPDINDGFNELTTNKIVGFRVNYNDPDTDEDEKELAKQFGVTYQHTKVILKDNKQIFKEIEQWDKDRLVKELGSL